MAASPLTKLMLLFHAFTVIISAPRILASTTSGHVLFPYAVCSSSGNFTRNSTDEGALITLLSSITDCNSSSLAYGFFNASAEALPSQAFDVIGLCRGDITAEACRGCLNTSASDIRQLCPSQKEAILYNENCTLRYSNQSMLGAVKTDPGYQLPNVNNASNPNKFNRVLQSLLDGIRAQAASSSSPHKYATGNASVGFERLYAMVQCTPDLSEQQCSDCLVIMIARITGCCAGKIGGMIMAPSCNLRFATNSRFFDPETVTVAPGPPGKKNNTKKIVIIAVASTVSVTLITFALLFIRTKWDRKRRKIVAGEATDGIREELLESCPRSHGKHQETVEGEATVGTSTVELVQFTEGINTIELQPGQLLRFDFRRIKAATFNFTWKLGEGGFGAVYSGRLGNHSQIAVKRLRGNSCQGDKEFKNEVMLLARLQHRNLVRLLGFCLEGNERLLIYEFVPNSSLDTFIFDPDKRLHLDWNTYYKIIEGVARGLLYLHEDSRLRIIHRDLKASNILLDSDMNPKVSDFGTARLCKLNQTHTHTKRLAGTFGYMAPEYAFHGNFSVKSDVFSFGILIMEILCGLRNVCREGDDMKILVCHVWQNWRNGRITDIIDPSVTSDPNNKVLRCIQIALLCVQENVADRPAMSQILVMLKSNSETLPVPQQPAFLPFVAPTDPPQSTFHSQNNHSMHDYNSLESEAGSG